MRQGNFKALDHFSRRSVSLVLLLTSGVLKHDELLRGGTAQKGGPEASGTREPCPLAMGEALDRAGRGCRLAFLFYFPRCAEVWASSSGPARIVTGYNNVN